MTCVGRRGSVPLCATRSTNSASPTAQGAVLAPATSSSWREGGGAHLQVLQLRYALVVQVQHLIELRSTRVPAAVHAGTQLRNAPFLQAGLEPHRFIERQSCFSELDVSSIRSSWSCKGLRHQTPVGRVLTDWPTSLPQKVLLRVCASVGNRRIYGLLFAYTTSFR